MGVGVGEGVLDGVPLGVSEGVPDGVVDGVPLGVPDGVADGCPADSISAHPASTAATTTAAARRFTPGLTTPLLTHERQQRVNEDTQPDGNPAGDR